VAEENTREKLVSHARAILNQAGYQALTLRSAARAAGLSPGAPYRHFEHGFQELLATLAIEGFEDLVALLERSGKSNDARERIVDVALAYVRFGVERPDLYRAMFSSQLATPLDSFDELFQAGKISFSSRETYATLAALKLQAFERIVRPFDYARGAGVLKPGDTKEFALGLSALVHGLVGEFIDEGLGIRMSRKQPWSKVRREMSRSIVEMLLSGLERA
jgi:AcrR family transcriptional regulator